MFSNDLLVFLITIPHTHRSSTNDWNSGYLHQAQHVGLIRRSVFYQSTSALTSVLNKVLIPFSNMDHCRLELQEVVLEVQEACTVKCSRRWVMLTILVIAVEKGCHLFSSLVDSDHNIVVLHIIAEESREQCNSIAGHAYL